MSTIKKNVFSNGIPNSAKYISLVIIITSVFLILVATDITPLVRGPVPWPHGWRWEYSYTNTLQKVIFPVIAASLILVLFTVCESKKNFFKSKEGRVLFVLIGLHFVFIMSIFHYSRAGIPVLVHRIIDPDLNGYFTASQDIDNVGVYIRNYTADLHSNPGHAISHPPGSVLLFWATDSLISITPFIKNISSYFSPHHSDVRAVWEALSIPHRTSALFFSFFIPVLSSIVIVPLYYLAKRLYGAKIALRSAVFYMFIPNVIFFNPLNDVFFSLFSLISLYLSVAYKSKGIYFLSGLLLSAGFFVTLSLLPFLLLINLYIFFEGLKAKDRLQLILTHCVLETLGAVMVPILMFVFFQFNIIIFGQMVMAILPKRPYFVWIFYVFYDFLIFTGIPASLFFITYGVKSLGFIRKKLWSRVDIFLISFLLVILALNFSGRVQGEIGRIWLPFSPILIIFASHFLTKKLKFSRKAFVLILIIQFVQILVMQEFWIMGEYADYGKSDEQCFTLTGRCK